MYYFCRFCGKYTDDGNVKDNICFDCMDVIFKCKHALNCNYGHNCPDCDNFVLVGESNEDKGKGNSDSVHTE